MTDKEIVRALECCSKRHPMECSNCPKFRYKDCIEEICAEALGLISKQLEEIKSLKRQNNIINRFLLEAWGRIDELDKLNESIRKERPDVCKEWTCETDCDGLKFHKCLECHRAFK